MLLNYFKEYQKSGVTMSLPGFRAFVISKYPDAYEDIVKAHLNKDPDFDRVLILLEGSMVTQDLDNEVNSKAVDRVLKKYHGYDTVESSNDNRVPEIRISIDPKSSNG